VVSVDYEITEFENSSKKAEQDGTSGPMINLRPFKSKSTVFHFHNPKNLKENKKVQCNRHQNLPLLIEKHEGSIKLLFYIRCILHA
jgi:hypothetical protein